MLDHDERETHMQDETTTLAGEPVPAEETHPAIPAAEIAIPIIHKQRV